MNQYRCQDNRLVSAGMQVTGHGTIFVQGHIDKNVLLEGGFEGAAAKERPTLTAKKILGSVNLGRASWGGASVKAE